MKFFHRAEEENTVAGIRSRMKKEKMLYVQRLITQEEYEARVAVLEAQLAEVTGGPSMPTLDFGHMAPPPQPKPAADPRLKELDYLLEKNWITPEGYEARKKEILEDQA